MIAISVAAVLVLATVGIHFEALRAASRLVLRLPWRRLRVAAAIVVAIAAHLVEIVVFALGWALLEAFQGPTLTLGETRFADQLYYSGVVYTSLGFGDVLPVGPARWLTVVEAVLGLVLIAWTASFTFFEMQRHWTESGGSAER